MSEKNNLNIWLLWLGLMLILMGYLTYTIINGEDKSVFMPGELTGGHHQIGIACNACHGQSFSDKNEIQKKCTECHGEQRKKPFDSHPRSKFTDPRNADRLENINALYCVSCHVEHRPDIADKTGLTQPEDFCIHCHEDIGKDRPSHKAMEFNTCANAGCHNFHNNRALYTDFLVKHMDEPNVLEHPAVPKKEFSSVLDEIMSYPRDQYPVKELMLKDSDAPPQVVVKANKKLQKIRNDWLNSAHAKSGANCTSCHVSGQTTEKNTESNSQWTNTPDQSACSSCHDTEVKHFMRGKHGMRLKQGLSAMSPADARLPMKADAVDEINCNSCHPAHQYKLNNAAIDACLSCHNDEHSLAYKKSPHYALWQKEQSGELPEGSGVSCATCHMPRVSMDVSEWSSRIVVQHNQNATLVPNEKMIRPACMNCHGLGFSIDSLADEVLIRNNFNGMPATHIESIDMAKQDNQRHLERINDNSD